MDFSKRDVFVAKKGYKRRKWAAFTQHLGDWLQPDNMTHIRKPLLKQRFENTR